MSEMELPSFVCDGCGRKAMLTYDEFVMREDGRTLCPECAERLLAAERVFLCHVPASMDMEHHLTHYSTWEDLEEKLRTIRPWMKGHRIGCSDVTERTAMLLDVYRSGKEVIWWEKYLPAWRAS